MDQPQDTQYASLAKINPAKNGHGLVPHECTLTWWTACSLDGTRPDATALSLGAGSAAASCETFLASNRERLLNLPKAEATPRAAYSNLGLIDPEVVNSPLAKSRAGSNITFPILRVVRIVRFDNEHVIDPEP